jgi:hypothetical protein
MTDHSSDNALPMPICSEEAAAASLAELPRMIRAMADARLELTPAWNRAYGNCRERKAALALYFHCDEDLGISAAEHKASIDPQVIDACMESLRIKAQITAYENAEQQLLLEFEARVLTVGQRPIANGRRRAAPASRRRRSRNRGGATY